MPQKMLSDAFLRTVKPPQSGQADYFDLRVPAFALRVSCRGVKSWVAMYRLDGKLRRDTFARYPGLSLSEARERAGKIFELARAGKDPRIVAERERAAEARQRADTVEAIGTDFLEKYVKANALRTHDERKRALEKYVYPAIGSSPLKEVTRRDVIDLVDKIAKDHGPIMARRTYSIVRKMFKWAVQRDVIDANPCSDIALPGREKKRDRTLADEEVKLVWLASDRLVPVHRDFVRMLLVTAQRRSEVADIRRSEINEGDRVWIVPADRMKGKLAHAVALAPLALEIIAGSKTTGECLFRTARDTPIRNFSGIKDDLDKAILDLQREAGADAKPLPHWTLHDLRRTARTNMSKVGISAEIAERCLAHLPPGIRGVYDLHDFLAEKRSAMERWGQHLAGIVDPSSRSNVVQLTKAAGNG
jgi:integrase